MKTKFWLIAFIAIALFQSCSEDIDTLAEYKDVCLIWAFLDKSDTSHYIIVQKGFVNPQQDAYVIAQNTDSLFFKDIEVTVQEELSNGGLGQKFTLTQVDLQNEGIAKDSGTFGTSPNYAYRFDGVLNPSSTYTVTVKKGDKEYQAHTPVLNVDASNLNVTGLQWVDSSRSLNFTPTRNQKLYWSVGEGANIFDGILTINYFDVFDSAPNDTIAHTVKWRIINKEVYQGISNMQASPSYDDLIFNLNSQIPAAVNGQKRYIGFLTLEIYAGSERLTNYIILSESKGGLAANQVTPEFTEGFITEDTYGLFDTRGHGRYPYLQVNDSTMFYLQYSMETSDLNIVGRIRK